MSNMIRESVFNKAKSYEGLKESPANSNNVLFNTIYYGKPVNNKDLSWCVVYIWYIFRELCLSGLFYDGEKCASCTTLLEYYRKKGMVTTTPKKGDLVFFQFDKDKNPDHVGFFQEWKTSTTFYSEEGNTGIGNDSNGGEVMNRLRNKSQVIAFVNPYKEIEQSTQNPYTMPKEDIIYNSKNVNKSLDSVKWMQFELGVQEDGMFGNKTLIALKNFQKAKKIKVQSICDNITKQALMDDKTK